MPTRYRSPDQMADRLIELALRHQWSFAVEQIAAWRKRPVTTYSSGDRNILVPDIWLGSLLATATGLWTVVSEMYPAVSSANVFEWLRLFGVQAGRTELSLGWVVIDPLDNPGRDPTQVRTVLNSVGLQMLALLIFQPEWADEFLVYNPRVGASQIYWLPGLVALLPSAAQPYMPCLQQSPEGAIHFDADLPRVLEIPSYSPIMRRLSR